MPGVIFPPELQNLRGSMKYRICLILIIIFSINVAFAQQEPQQKSEESPETIWGEYLALKPPIEEFMEMLYGLEEPYKSWCAEEILARDPNSKQLRYLVQNAPEPYANTAWLRLKTSISSDDLAEMLAGDFANEKYREEVFKLLFDQDLDLETLRFLVVYGKAHSKETWERFTKANPSAEDWLYIFRNGGGPDQETSLMMVLNSYISTEKLRALFDEQQFDRIDDVSLRVQALLASELLARQDITSADLHAVENHAPEPYSTMAHNMRVASGELARDKIRHKMCLSCGVHVEKEK